MLHISLKISTFVINKKNIKNENKERACNLIFPCYFAQIRIRETYFMDQQLQTAGQKIIQNGLQKRSTHTFRPSNINDFRLSGRALTRMNSFRCTYRQFINKWNPRQEFRPQIRDSRWFSNRLMVKVLENRVLKRGGFRAEKGGKSGVKA